MPIFTIEKTINKALGLSETEEGLTVFIPGTLPNEVVKAKIRTQKKDYANAKLQSIITPHPGRVVPTCQYLPHCGGCNLQHASEDLQPNLKSEIVKDNLLRFIGEDVGKIKKCLPAPKMWNYRQRLRLHTGEYGTLGFKKFQSHNIIEVNHCLLAKEEINTALSQLTKCNFHNLTTICEQVELLFNPKSKMVSIIFRTHRKPRPADHNRSKEIIKECPIIERVYFLGQDYPLTLSANHPDNSENNLSIKYDQTGLTDSINLQWEVGGFCQVNLDQNRKMIELILNLINIKNDETVLDLFCGMGNFSIPLAMKGGVITGYEGQGSAIRSAKKNAANNNVEDCQFFKGNIHKICTDLIKERKKYDYLVIDPPRQGAPQLTEEISMLCKKKLIYISCDPATLGRDLQGLKKVGFNIKSIQPIDMFPQTHHIETVVLLDKGN
ncbi:MAG: 23S rRNA (uracil(1939)-C(5))-methyltransferase RlmD [Desulfotalea sp.]